MNIRTLFAACVFPIAFAVGGVANANVAYTVNVNTTSISGGAGYALAFSFQDGSTLVPIDNNNTVLVSNFAFGGGSAGGSPVTDGGASGSLGSSVTLTDSAFSNLFVQEFTPGSSLSFNLDLTTNLHVGDVADFFGFGILFNGDPLPTLDDTLGDNLLYFNIDSANPSPSPWATTDDSIAAPEVALAGPAGQLPEPESLLLTLTALGAMSLLRQRRPV